MEIFHSRESRAFILGGGGDPPCRVEATSTDIGDPSLSIRAGVKVTSVFHLKQIEYGVYGDLTIIYPKPYSIYLRGPTISGSCVMLISLIAHGLGHPRS